MHFYPRNPLFRKRSLRLILGVLLVCVVGGVRGQVVMNTTGNYSQNFNSLINTGTATWTNNTTIPNWYMQRTGTGIVISANDGTAPAGNAYSFGAGSTAERALGSIGSGNASAGNFAWGLLLQNTSGNTITDFSVAYTGEQWRNNAAAAQTVNFYYRISSTLITDLQPNVTTGWTAVSALNFTSPVTGGTAGALNGNAASNRTVIGAVTIPAFLLPSGYYLLIKWDDPDHSGSDHGLAIDDLTISWVADCITPSTQSSNLNSAVPGFQNINLAWTNGNGAGRIIVINTANSFTNPLNGVSPVANPLYSGTGEQVIYNGSGNSVNIAGLDPCRTYYFRAFEYNCSGANIIYNTNAGANNPANITTSSSTSGTTTVISEDFEGATVWPYSLSSIIVGSGGSGINVTEIRNLFGFADSRGLVKSHTANNSASQLVSEANLQFEPVSIPVGSTNIRLLIKIASLNEIGNFTPSDPFGPPEQIGRGNDSGEDFILSVRLNGAGGYSTTFTQEGFSNKLFDYSPQNIVNLAWNANANYPNVTDQQNDFIITIPNGTTLVELQIVARNNRTQETWCIDDLAVIADVPAFSSVPLIENITGANSYCQGGTGVEIGLNDSETGVSYQLYLDGNPVGSPISGTGVAISFGYQTAAGTYTVTAFNSTYIYCTAEMANPLVVVVNALPTVSITGDNEFCTGDDTELTANATAGSGTITGYQWNLGGTAIPGETNDTYTATAPGSYTVTVTNSNGCETTSTAFVVTENALPTVSITGDNEFCTGDDTELTANATAGSGTITGYQWNLGGTAIPGETNDTYTATAPGSYTVTVTNS
ncbi:MAG: PKD domain-containing protein, partial [Lentimicrobium sp.]|nr:PKD domain-containing protein [Lentimicrobium sp.]